MALLGDQVIPFEIAGVKSGNVTRGHRILGACSIPVTIANYESELRKNFVILSAHERRHKIETEAAALGAKLDADLLETLTYITEYPDRDPRRFRSRLSGTARRSADHGDAASPEILFGGRRHRQARAALRRGDEHQRRSGRSGQARQRARAEGPLQRRALLLERRSSRRSWPIASKIWRT